MSAIDDALGDFFEISLELLEASLEANVGTSTRIARGGRAKGQFGLKARAIRAVVLDELVPQFQRMTVRKVFYALSVKGVVPKTQNGGYRAVQEQLARMRREGVLDWGFIADGTRLARLQSQWDDVSDFLGDVQRLYRRDLWRGQGVRIEVWLEKDALAEVVLEKTTEWRVPLMVTRGQSSVTFLHSAAMSAKQCYERDGTQTWVYALYDFDAGGDRAYRAIESDLPAFAETPINVERLAITPAQIAQWQLPTPEAEGSREREVGQSAVR